MLFRSPSPSAVPRLTEMGVEPFLVGSAMDSVLAQRLARRLCPKCKDPYQPTPLELEHSHFPWVPGEPVPELYRPVGCPSCARTGYKGRLALHELMLVGEDIERLAVSRSSGTDIGKVARAHGMVSLRDDGWTKVRQGITSIAEILRVVS